MVAMCLAGSQVTSPYGCFLIARCQLSQLLTFTRFTFGVLGERLHFVSTVTSIVKELLFSSRQGLCLLDNRCLGQKVFLTTKLQVILILFCMLMWVIMKSRCVVLLGLYLVRGACMSLIEGSLWHGCPGPSHLEASSGSRWGEIRRG